jgi:hypothetical protein
MGPRRLLSDEERQALFGIPLDADDMARCFTLSRRDQELVAARRRDAKRIGFAVQLALLRYASIALAQVEQPIEPLVQWLARRLDISAAPFADYMHRPQTMTDHARLLATTLGLRSPVKSDLPMMIEAASDRGQPITAAVVVELRAAKIILPAVGIIERAAIAGRARARRRATDALIAGVSTEQMAKLEQLLVFDASVKMTPFPWLKAMPVAPKADYIRELLERLYRVRDISLAAGTAETIHPERLRQFVREGCRSDAHQLGRYTTRRRRAILVATILDLEARLTDAVLHMADRLIGGLFAKARNATRRHYAASAGDVARPMRLFHGTIEALAVVQEGNRDAFVVVDEVVGWAKLLRVRSEVANLADLAEQDPLLRAAERWRTLHKFAPDLIEALEFRAARPGDPMLAALKSWPNLTDPASARCHPTHQCHSARTGVAS